MIRQNPIRRFAANSIFSSLSFLFPIALSIVVTPILIRNLGNERYGLFAFAVGFVAMAFSSGIGRVAAKYIPEYRAASQPEKIPDLISTTFLTSLVVGLFQGLLLFIAAPWLVSDVLLVAAGGQADLTTALKIAAFAGFLTMLGIVFQATIQGHHRFDTLAVITNISALFLSAGYVSIVLSGFGFTELLIWNFVIAVATSAAYFFSWKKKIPDARLGKILSQRESRPLLKYAGSIAIYQTLTNIFYVFERSLVTRKFGPEAFAFYAVPSSLALYMHGVLASIIPVFFGVINEILADKHRLEVIYKKATKTVLVIVFFVIGHFIGVGKSFLELWLGTDFSQNSYSLLLIIGTAIGINAIGIVAWQFAEALHHPTLNALSSFTWLIIAIPFMIFLSQSGGSDGVAIGRLIGAFATVPIMFYVERKCFGRNFWSFWLISLLKVSIAIAALLLVETLFNRLGETRLSWFAISAMMGTLVFVFSIFALRYFSNAELEGFRRIVGSKAED